MIPVENKQLEVIKWEKGQSDRALPVLSTGIFSDNYIVRRQSCFGEDWSK
jgi:hypothetical protein